MKSFATLIKLQKTYVDEQRQQLARMQDHLDMIVGKIAQMEIIKVREQAAAKDYAASATYGAFLQKMVLQERALEKERQTAESAVKIAQDKLAALFEEQKRYEIAEAQRIEDEAKAERRIETLTLDEIGAIMHERNRE